MVFIVGFIVFIIGLLIRFFDDLFSKSDTVIEELGDWTIERPSKRAILSMVIITFGFLLMIGSCVS